LSSLKTSKVFFRKKEMSGLRQAGQLGRVSKSTSEAILFNPTPPAMSKTEQGWLES
jgi:hypothetical protein